MTTWHCGKCLMAFTVKRPHANSKRHGCPECRLWFHAGSSDRQKVTLTVAPEDLAKHKAAVA